MVKLLLTDYRVNPLVNGESLMNTARQRREMEMYNLLYKDFLEYPYYDMRRNNILIDIQSKELILERDIYAELFNNLQEQHANEEFVPKKVITFFNYYNMQINRIDDMLDALEMAKISI